MGTHIIVREATVGDAVEIARVWFDGWKSAYSKILPDAALDSVTYEIHEAAIRRHLVSRPGTSAAFVAVEDASRLLGVALVRATQSAPRGFSAELDAIYVAPSRQREGVGRRLVLEAARWARRHSDRGLCLWVARDNPYRRFYDGLGARLLGREQQQTIGDCSLTAVAYGWRDLADLILRLGQEADPSP